MIPETSEVTNRQVSGSELAQLDLFHELPVDRLDELARHFVELRVSANQVIYRQGEASNGFYLVKSGALAVFRDAVGQPVQLLARLYQGDFFGEVALFGSGQATASVRASEPSQILRIGAEGFLPFLELHPEVQLQLQMAAARRQSNNLAAVLETGRRREVRIRCRQPVNVERPGDAARSMVLENLSLGGICLSDAWLDWQVGQQVEFTLHLREGGLELRGDVRWRQGDSVGMAFTEKSAHHDMLIQMAIRLIHESAQGL